MGSVPPAPTIIYALSKAYHSHTASTGKLRPLFLQKSRCKSTCFLQTKDTKQGLQQFLQNASYAKQGQKECLMKSEDEGFAEQRMTSLFRGEFGKSNYHMFPSGVLHDPLYERELMDSVHLKETFYLWVLRT